jgi:GTP pyrophosphokinase
LKEEKRKVAEDGKYTVQRKIEGMGAAFNQHNIDELWTYYKLSSALDLFYQVAIKNIDLKELKEFKVFGDKIEAPRPVKIHEIKVDGAHHHLQKKTQSLSYLEKAVIRSFTILLIAANLYRVMMYLDL